MSREDTTASSHRATTEWQSFETRMRRRRAERCLQRAAAALAVGNPDEARAAVEEARLLDASIPEFETLHGAVEEQQPAAPLPHRTWSGRRLTLAASLLLVTVGGVGATVWQRVGTPLAPVAVATSGGTLPQQPVTAASLQPQNAEFEVVEAKSDVVDTTKAVSPDASQPLSAPEFSPASLTVPVAGHQVEMAVLGIPATERTTLDVGTPVPGLPVQPLPEVVAPPTPAVRTADVAMPAAPPVDERPEVRAALAQYESAYSTLDVSAVQAIWPAVDARALARAFEGLDAQRVSLGSCSVRIDGAAARADCSGTASWTPKIGGGTQTGSRNWQFELKKVDGAWQIVRADLR